MSEEELTNNFFKKLTTDMDKNCNQNKKNGSEFPVHQNKKYIDYNYVQNLIGDDFSSNYLPNNTRN